MNASPQQGDESDLRQLVDPEQLHASFMTPPHEIEAVVACVTANPIARHKQIARGFDNEVHSIITTNGANLFVHIRRHGELPFTDIVWALERALAAGAPVPEVLHCDRRWLDGTEREVMIQRGIPGRPLEDLISTLSDEQLRWCYLQALPALARIHSVKVEGFKMRRNGVWDYPDWSTMATAWSDKRSAERASVLAAGFTQGESQHILSVLDELQRRFAWEQPVLLHGDFTPGHLFFDDALNFTGLLDFGQFHGGSPAFDFNLLLGDGLEGDGNRLQMAWVHEGYGPAAFWDDLAVHRLLYALHNDLGLLHQFVTYNQSEPLAIMVSHVRTWLAEVEDHLKQ